MTPYLDVDLKELVVAMMEEILGMPRGPDATIEDAYDRLYMPDIDSKLILRVEAGCIRIMRIYNEQAKLVS